MKRLVLSIALLACLPVFAQDQGTPSIDSRIYHRADGYRIEATVRLNGSAQQVTVAAANLQWIDHNACVINLTGNVEVTAKGFVLQADEADYHCGTGDIEPRGNVHLKVLPER